MTEINPTTLQQHAATKRRAVRTLRRALREVRPVLEMADARLLTYLDGVAQSPRLHNLYEVAGAAVFCLKAARYVWRPERMQRFVRFYEVLPFDGVQGQTSYRMTPVQVFVVANLFGLYEVRPDGQEVRLHRDAYLFVPRKFAKTTLAAAVAVYFLLFGDYNSEAYVIANSYEQAKVCFNMQRSIMQALDPDQQTFRINRETIFFQSKSSTGYRASKSRCLAANPKNLDGLFAELVIRDEGAQAHDTATKSGAELKGVLVTSEGPRLQPLNIDISTASDVVDGPFAREIEGCRQILLQAI